MKNLQLIKRLLELPLDDEVYRMDGEYGPVEIDGVKVEDVATFSGEKGIVLR